MNEHKTTIKQKHVEWQRINRKETNKQKQEIKENIQNGNKGQSSQNGDRQNQNRKQKGRP